MVVRTGRTDVLTRRAAEHARGSETGGLSFNVVYRTDVYAEQRGLEQVVYIQNPTALSVNRGLNKIKPISDKNPKITEYEEAALNFLTKGDG